MKKLLLDSGGLVLALQPLSCNDDEDDDMDEDHPAKCGRLLSDWFNSPLSGLTSQLHSLYFSLLIGCLSTLTGGIKMGLDKNHFSPATVASVSKANRVSPPPSKKPRLADACPYEVSDFDLLLLLDDGIRVPANREAVTRVEGTHEVGSEYFQGLLRGGFVEAQGNAEEAIRIKDASAGMLIPVLHYLHGCRLTKSTETRECDEGERCQILDKLVLEGLGLCQTGTGEDSVEDVAFQKMALGEVMIGARRFLVTELQRELEGLCVSLLLSCSTKAASAPTEDGAGKFALKTDRDNMESAEESLANQTSELELTSVEVQAENIPGLTKRPNGFLQQADRNKMSGMAQKASRGVTSDNKTIKSAAPVSKSSCAPVRNKSLDPEDFGLRSKTSLLKSAAQGSLSSSETSVGGGALAALLPQIYWFSQCYSYPALGRACLSLLLGCQECPRPFFSSSLAADCLHRLARKADCTETLKQDLLNLATVALS